MLAAVGAAEFAEAAFGVCAAAKVATARIGAARNRFFTGVLDLGEIRTV